MVPVGSSLTEEVFVLKDCRKRGEHIRTAIIFYGMAAFLVLIASAMLASAQSNMNCSIFNRSEVPADMVPLVNFYKGNDSHVEYGNLTNYNWTVACKSNITDIGGYCVDNYVSVLQIYNYTDAHVSTDGYYSRDVCFNTSNTSLAWTVQLSAVGATPAGYECMFAIANQSNAHVYGCGNVNASYDVNIRIGEGASIAGGIVIWGPNGTEVTNTRNVFLNLTYDISAAVECRWANDGAANLTSMLWENCTTVKPWILSEGEGNKIVYFEIRYANATTAIDSDSILYEFIQDFTAPSAPVVYDSDTGSDIDWWNSNTTLSAYWWNATDDIGTIHYKYRIINQTGCYDPSCGWTDVGTDTEATAAGLTLYEGANYSFEILAYTNGLLNTSAVSNGTLIDLTDPDSPTINSSTHPDQDTSYGENNVRLNFTASDPISNGVASGIEGYSYLLDQYPGTAPDNNLEGRQDSPVQPLLRGNYGQVLKINGTGSAYAVFSQLKENFTIGESVKVRVALAEQVSDYDDLMDVHVYLMSAGGNDIDVTAFDNEASAITTIANVSQDIRYSEQMSSASVYEFDLTVTSNLDETSDDVYVVVAGNNLGLDDDNRNNLSIAGTQTGFDNITRNFVCDESDNCDENTSTLDYAIEVRKEDSGDTWDVQYDNLADGIYYFHAKAKDIAGNWGDTAHYAIMIDTGGVAVDITSPFTGQVFSTGNIEVDVEVDGQASVEVIALHPDGNNDTSATVLVNDTYTFNITLANGTNEIYARAINPLNGVISYSQSVFVRLGTGVPTGNRTLRVSYPGAAALSTHIEGTTEGSMVIGIATENDTADFGGSYITSDTGSFTIKIFATTDDMKTSKVENDLDDDEFLDRINPMFGYTKGVSTYIVRTEMRPQNVYFEGTDQMSKGKYTLVFKNVGTTPDGRTNVSVRIV